MIKIDRDALICDLAEIYHIYSLDSLPVLTVATLAVGLRENSRIKLKMTGQRAPTIEILLATMIDRFTAFASGGKIEESILEMLIADPRDTENDLEAFESAEAFEARRNEIIRRATCPQN